MSWTTCCPDPDKSGWNWGIDEKGRDSISTASTTATATAPARVFAAFEVDRRCYDCERGRTKMNAIASAVLSGLLYFTRGPTGVGGCSRKECEDSSITAARQTPHLPPELYSVITSHLSYDQHTLASCALVSSAWRSTSRKHLFYTITLTYTNIQPFLELLCHPLCSFKNAIKVVKIREGEFIVDRWMDQFLPRLIASLNDDVPVLDVYNLTWAELSPRSVRALQHGIRGMQSLRVGTCYWECVHGFAELVCSKSFDGLRHLVCDYVLLNCSTVESCECERLCAEEAVGDDDEETSQMNRGLKLYTSPASLPSSSRIRHRIPPARLPQTLESLYLSLPEESMLHWFTTQDAAMRGLKKLGIVVRDSTVMQLVEELVSMTGGALEELVLDLPLGCSISLAKNVSLRTLHLSIPSLSYNGSQVYASTTPSPSTPPSYHHHPEPNHPLQTLHKLLSSLSSPSLHTLIFDIDASTLHHLHNSTLTSGRLDSRLYDFASILYPILSNTNSTTPPHPLSLIFAVRYFGTLKTVEWAKEVIFLFVQVLREESSLSSVDCSRWDVRVEGVRVGCGRSGVGSGEDEDDGDGVVGKDGDGGDVGEEEDAWRREGVGEVWRSWMVG